MYIYIYIFTYILSHLYTYFHMCLQMWWVWLRTQTSLSQENDQNIQSIKEYNQSIEQLRQQIEELKNKEQTNLQNYNIGIITTLRKVEEHLRYRKKWKSLSLRSSSLVNSFFTLFSFFFIFVSQSNTWKHILCSQQQERSN